MLCSSDITGKVGACWNPNSQARLGKDVMKGKEVTGLDRGRQYHVEVGQISEPLRDESLVIVERPNNRAGAGCNKGGRIGFGLEPP